MDRHEDPDVVADRNIYLIGFFENEIQEHCWIQMPAWKLNHLKYKEQLCVKDNDINTQMQAYIKKHRMHYYTENSIQMVEVHVDDIYAYDDDGDKNLPKLGPYGGNTSVRIPEGRNQLSPLGRMKQSSEVVS